ncbi:MAG: phenylalanine--tRNA ligase subunit beta [Candidatus Marsarchaeota archaeon]|nr:phenylalanine--tRNA ligase subunit beta [Candidatus Marsarchaeota archaeon]
MPTCRISSSLLRKLIGDVTPELLEEAVFNLKGEMRVSGKDYELELTSDRPDMMCASGLARAVKGYLGVEKGEPKYVAADTDFTVRVDVSSLSGIRPYCDFLVVKGVKADAEVIGDILAYQEKLHSTLSAGRVKFAIGVHDYSRLQSHALVYQARDPSQIVFTPLNGDAPMNANNILTSTDKGVEYAHLLKGCAKYPVFATEEGEVLSMPPIINAKLTQVSENTTDFIVDVTGTDRRLTHAACEMVAYNICEYGGALCRPAITGLKVVPRRKFRLSVGGVNRLLGTSFTAKDVVENLSKSRLDAAAAGGAVHVNVPGYRVDLIDDVDLVEDVAVMAGYNGFTPERPSLATIGGVQPSTRLASAARNSLASLGFVEFNSLLLTSENQPPNPFPEIGYVRVSNPYSKELNRLRAWLYPGLLWIVFRNQTKPKPLQVYEVGAVAYVSCGEYVQAVHAAAAISANTADSLTVEKLFNSFCRDTGYRAEFENIHVPSFIRGRSAYLKSGGSAAGFIGEVDPSVLVEMGIDYPVALFEVELHKMAFKGLTLT